MAALSRARGHGSTCWQHPGRRVHANVRVEVLCAHNGTQHQPKHKNTPHALEQPISGSFPRAHTRRDPCGHGSPIVHARSAPHKPHLPSIAQLCIMSGTTLAGSHTLLHACATATHCESMATRTGMRAREQRERTQHARQRAKGGALQHKARQRLFLPREAPQTCTRAAYVPRLVSDMHTCPRPQH